MGYHKKFISIWNEIKKFPGFMGKKIAVDQLNDPTAFPWFLNFFNNLSEDHRKCKSKKWDYLISIHRFNPFIEYDPINQRSHLIKRYNERLLVYSKDKINPWVIDERDNIFLTLNKKKYLEFDNKLNFIIDEEIAKKLSCKDLTKKEILFEKKCLLDLVKLALLKTFKEESIEEFNDLTINCQDWQEVYENFIQLISLELNDVAIQHEIKNQLKNNYREFYSKFLREKESVKIYSFNSVWEKVNKFVIKNKAMQFFYLIWSGCTSHANLLNWISFFLIFFSLSLYSYPIIFLILGLSLVTYLVIRLLFLIKKDTTLLPKINENEAELLLEAIKSEVYNEEKNKEFKLIRAIVNESFKKNINIKNFIYSVSTIQKKSDPIYLPVINIRESQLYQYLTEVYPKTQFIASLTINLTSILFYTYLLAWAIQSFLTVLGAISLAAIISSPITVGALILITASFFLIAHFCEFRAREDFYERTILNRMDEKCEYSFKNTEGRKEVIQIEKWKKFEYLQDNICFLELRFKNFFEKNSLDTLNNQFYSLFNSYIVKKNVYNSCDQEGLGGLDSFLKILKEFSNRFFAFFGGGLYGYNLTLQIVWKSKLGLHILVKVLTLPILLTFIPLIIINGIANLVTHHFHSRQQNRFEMVKNLDSKLEILEQTNRNLLYLAALLDLEFKHSVDSNDNVYIHPKTQSDLFLSSGSKYFNVKSDHCSFFNNSVSSSKTNLLKPSDLSESCRFF